MTCNPKNIIRKSNLRDVQNFADGDTEDIATAIMRMDKTADQWVNPEAAQCLRGRDDYETLRNVWRFVKHNVRYKTDKPGLEVVKSPGALFTMGAGDCKSFSIAEAAILRALGFKGIRYRFAAYGTGHQVTHVYIVCKLGGEDVILDAVYGRFDAEEPYTYKKDIPAAKAAISGLPTDAPAQSFSKMQLIGLGLIVWAVSR